MRLKKKFLLCLLQLFVAFGSSAQNSTIDSLKAILLNAKGDTATKRALSNLSFELLSYGNYDEAMEYATQEKALCEKINYRQGLSDAHSILGSIWFEKGNYPEALKNYYKSLEIAEVLKNKTLVADAIENIALVYYEEGNYDDALKKHLSALALYKELGLQEGVAVTLINLGSVYSKQQKYKEALLSFFEALKIEKDGDDVHGYLMLLSNIGSLYGDEKKYTEGMKYYSEALMKAEEVGDKSALADIYTSMGNSFHLQARYSDAINYYQKGLAVAMQIGNLNSIKDCYSGLAEAYEGKGDSKKALSSYKNYITYRDSLFNEENTKKTVQTHLQYEFNKKEAAIKAEQEIKDAVAKSEIQKQKILKISVTVGSILLIVLMLLFFKRRKAEHILQVNRLENKSLRSQLNPHFIFNALASIQKYMIAHPELAQNYLAKFGKLMREVLENSEKEYISLAEEFAMLKKYMELESLRVDNGFDFEFITDANTDEEALRVPPLLFQPIVENAIWHGVANGASKGKITICSKSANDFLNIEIENSTDVPAEISINKKEDAEKKKSLGIQIVKDRLHLLSIGKSKKGSLTMVSVENGMKVLIEVPL